MSNSRCSRFLSSSEREISSLYSASVFSTTPKISKAAIANISLIHSLSTISLDMLAVEKLHIAQQRWLLARRSPRQKHSCRKTWRRYVSGSSECDHESRDLTSSAFFFFFYQMSHVLKFEKKAVKFFSILFLKSTLNPPLFIWRIQIFASEVSQSR